MIIYADLLGDRIYDSLYINAFVIFCKEPTSLQQSMCEHVCDVKNNQNDWLRASLNVITKEIT